MSKILGLCWGDARADSPQYKVVPTEDKDEDLVVKGVVSDIVQFSCAIYYVEEDEGVATIELMRIGALQGLVSVYFTTVDGSGLAGERYEATSGKVTFNAGENTQSVKIPITVKTSWSPTLEFKLQLRDPKGCKLGSYLHTCRVKVIDSDLFPSDKYAAIFEKELHAPDTSESKGERSRDVHAHVDSINAFGLFFEFCKLNFQNQGIAWRTILTLVMDQLENVYQFLILTLRVYMVDTLFATSDPTSESRLYLPTRISTAWLIALMYVLPKLLLHSWDIVKIRIDTRGRSRIFLQTGIFREYLNYSAQSRESVPVTDLQNALLSSCNDVAVGYTTLLDFVQLMGRLLVLTLLTLKLGKKDSTAVFGVLTMPVLMAVFGSFRSKHLVDATDRAAVCMTGVLDHVREACDVFPLYASYFQRPLANSRFYQAVYEYIALELPCDLQRMNNTYFIKWLGPVFVAIYIVLSTPKILSGEMNVGVFLATCDIMQKISDDFGAGYIKMMKMYEMCETLRDMCILLNMPTDLLKWKSVNRKRRQTTLKLRQEAVEQRRTNKQKFSTNTACPARLLSTQEAASEQHHQVDRADAIPIFLANITYCLAGKTVLNLPGRFQTAQGKIVCVKGKHGSGKTSLLKLISHERFPTTGEVFVPSHLRILQVSQQVMLINESVWENVIFGLSKPVSDMDLERIALVCERLCTSKVFNIVQAEVEKARQGQSSPRSDMSNDVFYEDEAALLEDEVALDTRFKDTTGEKSSWQNKLTYTEKAQIHLARAFVMNPEVLVLQRPFHHFSSNQGDNIQRMLREHVINRGIGMPKDLRHHRRPKTVFYTPESDSHEDIADLVWTLDTSNAVRHWNALLCETHDSNLSSGMRKLRSCCKTIRNMRRLSESSLYADEATKNLHNESWGKSVSGVTAAARTEQSANGFGNGYHSASLSESTTDALEHPFGVAEQTALQNGKTVGKALAGPKCTKFSGLGNGASTPLSTPADRQRHSAHSPLIDLERIASKPKDFWEIIH